MRTVTYQSSRQSSNHVKVHSGNAVRNYKSRYGKGIRPTYTVLQIKADSPVNWLYVYGCEDEALKLCEITHEVEFPGKGVWNVWDRILLMWGLEVQIYKNRNMTEKADELIRQMDNLWRFPPTLPPADSELEAERRNRFTVEFCSYKENIEGEDSVTSANEWRLIGLMNLVGYGATGLFPNLVKEKETVDCLIEEYMLNLKKVK